MSGIFLLYLLKWKVFATGRNSGTTSSPHSYLHQQNNAFDSKIPSNQKRSSASPSPSVTSTGS